MNSAFYEFINLRMITIKLTEDEDDWNKPAPRNP